MRISDWSSDVCSSDLFVLALAQRGKGSVRAGGRLLAEDGEFLHHHAELRVFLDELREGPCHALAVAAAVVEELDQGDVALGVADHRIARVGGEQAEEPTSELQSLMRTSDAVF